MKHESTKSNVAFLLAQIGAHAAERFAKHLSPLGLTPPLAGILRILGRQPGITQQALADLLGMFPSRLVLLLDDLEKRGLVERHARPDNRRSFALRLTAAGISTLEAIGRVARQHEQTLCAGLNESERVQLREYLEKIAAHENIRPGIHPGYRKNTENQAHRKHS